MRFRRRETGQDFDPSKVDLVAESADGVVELVIVRDAPWTGAESELATFQQKVQTYVSFALDGQMGQQFPDAGGKPWAIVVASTEAAGEPDERTRFVLDALMERLPAHGGQLRVRTVSG
ncbi:DUF6572 domain-containing protein [Nocardioides sp.]|uniref:DUF6572 domain-containing protein n=1 Tax=Nocardioides sp. TaxID=35761 RepID=UPI00351896A8